MAAAMGDVEVSHLVVNHFQINIAKPIISG